MSAAQLFLLAQLSQSSAASLGDLADRTLTDRSSVAAVVERLEAAGLVATNRDAEDRRRVIVQITREGQQRLASAPQAPTQLLLAAIHQMSAAQARDLCASLTLLTDGMGLADLSPGMLFEDRTAPPRSQP